MKINIGVLPLVSLIQTKHRIANSYATFILQTWIPKVIFQLLCDYEYYSSTGSTQKIPNTIKAFNTVTSFSRHISKEFYSVELKESNQENIKDMLNSLIPITKKLLSLSDYNPSIIWRTVPSRCCMYGSLKIKLRQTYDYYVRIVSTNEENNYHTISIKVQIYMEELQFAEFYSEDDLACICQFSYKCEHVNEKNFIIVDIKISGVSIGGCPFHIEIETPSSSSLLFPFSSPLRFSRPQSIPQSRPQSPPKTPSNLSRSRSQSQSQLSLTPLKLQTTPESSNQVISSELSTNELTTISLEENTKSREVSEDKIEVSRLSNSFSNFKSFFKLNGNK